MFPYGPQNVHNIFPKIKKMFAYDIPNQFIKFPCLFQVLNNIMQL